MRESTNNELLFLQTIGIFFVVLGHSLPQDYSSSYFFRAIYGFHMPLFVFLSGYLFQLKSTKYYNQGFVSFIRQKAIKLLVPYVVISSIAYFPKGYFAAFAVRPYELSLRSYIHGLVFPGDNPIVFFWFLPTIFLIFAVAYPMLRLLASMGKLGLTLVVLGFAILDRVFPLIALFNLNGVVHYIFFFLIGCLSAQMKLLEKGTSARGVPAILGALAAMIYLLVIYFHIDFQAPISAALLGILIWILFAGAFKAFKFNMIGTYSYQIYLLSWFPQVAIRILYYDLARGNVILGVLLSTSLTISISLAFAVFVDNKLKPAKVIIGL